MCLNIFGARFIDFNKKKMSTIHNSLFITVKLVVIFVYSFLFIFRMQEFLQTFSSTKFDLPMSWIS